MSDPALALSFFDPAREIYGTARSGTTILFEGRRPVRHAEGPALRQIGEGWRAELAEVGGIARERGIRVGWSQVRRILIAGRRALAASPGLGHEHRPGDRPKWETIVTLYTAPPPASTVC